MKELSRSERALQIFTEVRPGEGPTALLLFANVFLILCAYYFVKPLRDGWIAVSDIQGLSKMEVKAYSSFAQSLLFLFAIGVYARLSSLLPRRTLITRTTLFCMSNLVFFWLLQPDFFWTNLPGAGVAFYLWVGMFGLFVVAQFWAFVADLYDDESGQRLMPMIAIGATAGATSGSFIVEKVVDSGFFDSGSLLLLANLPLALSIWLTTIVDRRSAVDQATSPTLPAADAETQPENQGKEQSAFALIRAHHYLMLVAAITLLNAWVNTNGENLLFRVVQDSLQQEVADAGVDNPSEALHLVRDATTSFYGNFFFWVNLSALLLQALVASRLLAWGGFGAILLLLPTIALIGYTSMALVPLLAVVRFMKIAENATDYSINNTASQVLWLPTTTEMKYKAKPAISTFCVRMGDGLAAVTVLLGVHVLQLSNQAFFLVNAGLVAAWLLVAIAIVAQYGQLSRTAHHAL